MEFSNVFRNVSLYGQCTMQDSVCILCGGYVLFDFVVFFKDLKILKDYGMLKDTVDKTLNPTPSLSTWLWGLCGVRTYKGG